MARPAKYTDSAVVRLRPDGNSKLQRSSDRRAIVDLIMENGGAMSFGDINEHFACDMRDKVAALIRSSWLELAE